MNMPKRVTIELTNRCNRACRGCPRHKMTYPLGDMSLSLLKKIIEQLPPETIIVSFFRGESAFHPHFVEAFEMLSRFDEVQMATNGDFLTVSKQNAILEMCNFISYSLHRACCPSDLIEITHFLDAARSKGVLTQVSILETEIPIDAKRKLIDSWLRHVDRFRIYVDHSKGGFGDVDSATRFAILGGACHKPFSDMVVYWDGKVALCNHDWDNQAPLGDLNTQTVEAIWNGDKYRQVREFHLTDRRKQVNSCRDCDYWMTEYLPNKMFGEVYTNE